MKEKEFKEKIKNDIKEINDNYKARKGNIEMSEEELELKKFLNDIWTLRFEDSGVEKYYEKATVYVMFMDKDNLSNVVCKTYSLQKMQPRLKTTVPLYHLLYEMADRGEYHCYFVPNIFVFRKGYAKNCIENVKSSNVYYVDIDKIETEKPLYNCTKEEILALLYERYPLLKECPPSYVLRSGISGLHLYFTLKNTERLQFAEERRIHSKIMKELVEVLDSDRVCTNFNRYLRVPYSKNCKYNIFTSFMVLPENEKRYTREKIGEAVEKYLSVCKKETIPKNKETETKSIKKGSPVKKKKKKKPEEKKKYASNGKKKEFLKEQVLLFNKVLKEDLETWFRWHKGNIQGRRNNFFFIYSNILKKLGWSMEVIERCCMKLNHQLAEPLKESEIRGIVRKETIYAFGNDTIAEMLEFTEEEKKELQCRYSKEEREERNKQKIREWQEQDKERRRRKKEEKQNRIFQIIEENPEDTLKELGKKIGLAPSSTLRWKRKYDEWKNGLEKD